MRRKARVNAHKANAPAIAGLFVEAADTTDSSGYWSALSNAAPRNQVSLQHIGATTRIVRAVIPEMLRQDAKSWLLLHRPDHDEEFLVLPYPDIAILRHLR